jgi:hypothetical protein
MQNTGARDTNGLGSMGQVAISNQPVAHRPLRHVTSPAERQDDDVS